MKIFPHNKSIPGLSVSNSSVSDKPLIFCCIQLREMAHGMDGNERVLSVWKSWETDGYWKEGLCMGAVEKEKEWGYFQGCTGYYLCLIVLFLALLILSCFTEITTVILVHIKHTKLIAAAWQEPEKAREKSRSKADYESETPFAEQNWDFSTQILSALGGVGHKLEWCRHWLSRDVRPAVCFPVLVKGFLGSHICAPPVPHPLSWRFQEGTSAKPCENLIWLLPEQQQRGSAISQRYFNFTATVKQLLPRILQLLFHFPPLVKSVVKKLQEHGFHPGMW